MTAVPLSRGASFPYTWLMRRKAGFTLIELMIVVAIIGILAAIAVPKFAELIRKSHEGKLKGTLGSLRSALAVYYADMEGQYPGDMNSLTLSGKYMASLPTIRVPDFHAETAVIRHNLTPNAFGCGSGYTLNTGEWIFWSDAGALCGAAVPTTNDPPHQNGDFWIACTHTDTKGSNWSTY